METTCTRSLVKVMILTLLTMGCALLLLFSTKYCMELKSWDTLGEESVTSMTAVQDDDLVTGSLEDKTDMSPNETAVSKTKICVCVSTGIGWLLCVVLYLLGIFLIRYRCNKYLFCFS